MRLALLSFLVVAEGSTPSVKVVLSNNPDARCLDGSQAVYYISKGSNPKGVYIYHQGGGWCQDEKECATRSKGALGSSKQYPSTKDLTGVQTHILMTRDAKKNPLMHDWTFVWLPYCDGGSFAGQNISKVSPSPSTSCGSWCNDHHYAPDKCDCGVCGSFGGCTFSCTAGDGRVACPKDSTLGGTESTLYFQGKAIREAALDSLRATAGLDAATDVLIGGCSAGGAATYMHLDWYAAQLASAKVRGIPDSGWFLDGNYARDGKMDYDSRMEYMYTMINAKASLAPKCTSDLGYRCLFAPSLISYIKTPLFALNSRYDASMADGEYAKGQPAYHCTSYTHASCDAPSVNAFGSYVAAEMHKLLVPPHGAFLDSCFRHCSINCPDYDILINGTRAAQAVSEWYTQGSAVMPSKGFFDQGRPYPCADCCT